MIVTVIGAGNSGLTMAAHLSFLGCEVRLWNRTKSHITKLIDTKTIHVKGIFNGESKLSLVTDDLALAVNDSDLIMVTTPADSFDDLGRVLAGSMHKNTPILLNPGRSFGALRMRSILMQHNPELDPQVAETQTILYSCRKFDEDRVEVFSLKSKVLMASVNSATCYNILQLLPKEFADRFQIEKSVAVTSFGNVGMILHCAPLLLNSGWTENSENSYKYYYDGITPTIGCFIECMDHERVSIAEYMGYSIESTQQWMERSYGVKGETLYHCVRNNPSYKRIDAPGSLHHRYILEDVPYGLAQIERVAKLINCETKYITMVIDLAEALLEEDFRKPADWINTGIIEKLRTME